MTEMVSPDLLQRAREADPGITEITDDEGRRALVDREPGSPETFRVTILDEEGRETEIRSWEISAVPERPSIYPSDFPFVPDLACTIGVASQGRAIMMWMPSDCPVVPDESRSLLKENQPLEDLVRRLEQARGEEGDQARREKLQRILEEIGGDPPIQEVVARASPPPDPELVERYDQAFDTLVDQSRRDGWEEVEGSGESALLPQRTLSFERDGRLRRITLITMMGRTQLTLLQR